MEYKTSVPIRTADGKQHLPGTVVKFKRSIFNLGKESWLVEFADGSTSILFPYELVANEIVNSN